MTKVCLTGASGFAGSHILETILAETDWEVVCLVSFRNNGISENIKLSDRVSTHVHDLTTPMSHVLLSRLGPIDYIVNAASLCSVDESIADPVPFVQNNVNLMLVMLELARQVKPSVFIQVSTDEVYGDGLGIHSGEQAPHKPSNPYAASKSAQENLCWSYKRTYGVNVVVVNCSNMFGARQSLKAFIPKVIKATKLGETIQVHVNNGKPGHRYYLHASNLAKWVVSTLQQSGLIEFKTHLSGERPIDNIEIVKSVASILGIQPNMALVEAEGIRPGYDSSYAMSSRTERLPDIMFEEGLVLTVAWAEANKEWWLL